MRRDITTLESCIREQCPISGSELLTLCQHHGIAVHYKSAEMWVKKIKDITYNQCRILYYKGGRISKTQSVRRAYGKLVEIIGK